MACDIMLLLTFDNGNHSAYSLPNNTIWLLTVLHADSYSIDTEDCVCGEVRPQGCCVDNSSSHTQTDPREAVGHPSPLECVLPATVCLEGERAGPPEGQGAHESPCKKVK